VTGVEPKAYEMSESSIDILLEQSPFASLRRFVRPRPIAEPCEMCSVGLNVDHQHLLAPLTRELKCVCDACAVLFTGQAGTNLRRIPRRIRFLSDFDITDAQWDSLMLPIHLAFFFKSTHESRIVALYPSPAGPTESLLPLNTWDEIVQDYPALQTMEPDVEALLVHRVGIVREHYIVPIDECYKLVGLIRAKWRGLSGGAEVWDEIAQFFAGLKEHSNP
jgi:hypothetical protein